jgi:hypothetical protein
MKFFTWLRGTIVAIVALLALGTAYSVANYNATAGSGLSFGSLLISGTNYAAQLICDATSGTTYCAKVDSTGAVQVSGTTLSSILTAVNSSIPAGSNLIGSVSANVINTVTVTGTTYGTGVTITSATVSINQGTFGSTNGVVNAASTYNYISASVTTNALTGGSGGATGDYLSHCVASPTATSTGAVTIYDKSATVFSYPGGTSSLSNLSPFSIPFGAKSVNGAWYITTGTSITVMCVGHFT